MSEFPLVSAIMPTRGRSTMAHEAVRMWREQGWPNKELVIVDDLRERSFDVGVSGQGIKYVAVPRVCIGEKRNIAASMASGPIIMHWDSDDWYSPDRMEFQANMLMEKGVDLVGYHTMYFEDVELGGRYLYRGSPGYAIGVSQTYWRDSWERKPFEKLDVGEDDDFRAGRTVFCSEADGRIVARIHRGNTSDKRPHLSNQAQWQRVA